MAKLGLSERQYLIGDERQILSPNEIHEGMRLGIADLEAIPLRRRVRRSAQAISSLIGGESETINLRLEVEPWMKNKPDYLMVIPKLSVLVTHKDERHIDYYVLGRARLGEEYEHFGDLARPDPYIGEAGGALYKDIGLLPAVKPIFKGISRLSLGREIGLRPVWMPKATLSLE
jgi:hypothetical protein